MVSNYCTACVINWAPYQTPEGRCPQCGSGTVRRQEEPSDEAIRMHRDAVAGTQPTEPIDALELQWREQFGDAA